MFASSRFVDINEITEMDYRQRKQWKIILNVNTER